VDRNPLYLGDMLDYARKARQFVEGKSREDFERDEMLRLALVHALQIVGEAARRVSDDYKDAHPEIPWNQITGMRHRIVHDYVHINNDTVWETVTDDLPELIKLLEAIFGFHK
jgi:uncharacterized protein with HEPN domain